MDSHQLRMKVFPLSLADDARKWWINKGEGKIIVWEELVEKFFCKFYLESYDGEEEMLDKGDNWGIDPLEFISRRRMDDSILSNNNTTVDSFFKPYLITRGKSDTEKEDELSQKKHKYSNISKSIDEQPKKRMCKAKKFEAIQYSLGPNEEYIAIRRCEYDICERNKDNMSKIYQDIFQKKDNGWKISIRAEHSVFTPPKEKPLTTEAEPPVFTPRWFLKKPQTSPEEEGETRKQPSEQSNQPLSKHAVIRGDFSQSVQDKIKLPLTNIGVRNLAFFRDMLNEIGQLNIVASEDTCVWNLGPNGTFTVKDARNIIDQKTLPSLPSTSWDKIIPRKVNIFMWRLSLDRLPHKLNLSLRGMDISAISFSSCNANVESVNHIFFECIIASDLWNSC
ncbi:RNA-directed DNA polymerase, eukaryota [Tanacetum coccineum]